jgi:multidrug resistance efflux pump
MKYYSDILKKTFDTEKACLEAEKAHTDELALAEKQKKELAETRKARAKEVENAFKDLQQAQKNYNELRNKFVKDYGSFHMTFSNQGDDCWLSAFEDWFRIF